MITLTDMPNTLHKSERLCRKKAIEKLFAGGARSFSLFPLRVVYLPMEEVESSASILVSVSKRRFKRAVKRNRVKRQIREAYRLHKHHLLQVLQEHGVHMGVAFIYLADELMETAVIEERVKTALHRLAERVPAAAHLPANQSVTQSEAAPAERFIHTPQQS